MDKGKTIFLSGATGNSYVFTVYSWGSPLVSFGAVYSVLRRGKHGYSVIYIGSSENLSLHLKTHQVRRLRVPPFSGEQQLDIVLDDGSAAACPGLAQRHVRPARRCRDRRAP